MTVEFSTVVLSYNRRREYLELKPSFLVIWQNLWSFNLAFFLILLKRRWISPGSFWVRLHTFRNLFRVIVNGTAWKKKKERQIAKHFAENDWKPARSALKKVHITESVLCMVAFWIFILHNTMFGVVFLHKAKQGRWLCAVSTLWAIWSALRKLDYYVMLRGEREHLKYPYPIG